MAPVAKSTNTPGQNNRISAIIAPARTFRLGSPAAGFVRWHSLTLPPNTVAQLTKQLVRDVAIITVKSKRVVFFIAESFGG